MPRVVSYTPEWLSKPNPGHALFANQIQTIARNEHSTIFDPSSRRAAKPGPRRTIARRGSQIFVAVGKEIRWADLVYLKEAWKHSKKPRKYNGKENEEDNQFNEPHAQGYRVRSLNLHTARFMLIFLDPQNPGCRRHTTIDHFSTG
jgi:nucleoporin NUP82